MQTLQARWIDRDTAEAAAIRRVDRLEAKELLGRRDSKDCSGLVIPYCAPGDDQPRLYRVRRDNPEIEHKSDADEHGSEVNKYVQPPSSRNLLYFPPNVAPSMLRNVALPLLVTEGEFKTLALWRLANHESPAPRFLPVGLSGVWNWRGVIGKTSDAKGGRRSVSGVIPDFDLIEFKNRQVYVVFDADVSSKDPVRFAREALTRELIKRGALVHHVEWDAAQGKGVDDHLVLVGPDAVLAEIFAAEVTDDWQRRLLRTSSGAIKKILANAMTAFREAPEWLRASLRFDAFQQVASTATAPPWSEEPVAKWGDQHSRLAAEWLQRSGIDVTDDVAGKAALTVAMENTFHPLQDWLGRVRWDGTPRIDEWLTTYLGVESTEYTRVIGPKFLIMMVARALRPGCKADYMLVLEGQQGKLKSSALKALVPNEAWFTDQLPEIGSKDAGIQIQGIWLVEAAELDALGRAEASRVKAFLSSSTDRYRPPYGRIAEDFPRHAVMAGTTNKDAYLRDETGARRFWPVRVGDVNLNKLRDDREQLFAEAVQRFKSGEGWWPAGVAQHELAAKEQEQRFEEDVWTPIVLSWCDDPRPRPRFDPYGTEALTNTLKSTADRVLISEVLENAIDKSRTHWTRGDEMRVTSILKNAGWSRRRIMDGARHWFYCRPANAPAPPPMARHAPIPDTQKELPF